MGELEITGRFRRDIQKIRCRWVDKKGIRLRIYMKTFSGL